MAEAIPNTVAAIVAEPAPVALVDTCSLLDIIRAPARDNVPSELAHAAIRMLTATRADPRALWVIVAPQVPDEFAANRDSVIADVEKHIRHTEARIASYSAASAALGLPTSIAFGQFRAGPLVGRAVRVAEELLGSAVHLEMSDDCFTRGAHRAVGRRAPGRAGGEVKDCIIFEHCVDLANRLRHNGLGLPIVFVSSNTRDYFHERSVHPDVQADLMGVNVEFTTDLQWAARQLGV